MKRKTLLLGGGVAVLGGVLSGALKSGAQTPGAANDVPVPAQGKTNIGYLRVQIETRLDQMEASLATNRKAGPSTRNLPNGALASLYLGRDPKRAESLMRRLFMLQNMDETSPHYGEVPWQAGRPEIIDRNAEVFSSQAIGPMLLLYGDKLSPQFKTELRPHLTAFFAALKRREFKTPAYTNIYIMRFVNTILMGEAIRNEAAVAQGYTWMDEWLRYPKTAGVHEFNSPTYTAVDLNSLSLGYRLAQKPGAKAMFKAVLDFFWADLCANYFAGRGSYSGPHSRDYDFLGGWEGGVGYYYAAYGVRDDGTSNMLDLEKVYPLLNTEPSPSNYRPAPEILALARVKEKTVRSRFDASGFFDRMNYLTPLYAIGATTGGYGSPQEKLVTVELMSAKKLPVINIVPDAMDSPYGKEKTTDKSGHSKPMRLPLNPVSVQEKNALLVLGNINPAKAYAPSPTISVSVLLPVRADSILFHGKKVDASSPFQMPGNEGDTVGVREGRAGVAVRLLWAQGLQNQSPTVVLQADADGINEGAARFTVYLYRGAAQKQTVDQVPIGFLIMADECADDAALLRLMGRVQLSPVSASFTNGLWSVSANVSGVPTLSLGWDTKTKKVTTRRVGNENIAPFGPLTVNRDDWFARTLGADPAARP